MHHIAHRYCFTLLLLAVLTLPAQPALAADGFDNNYISNDANQLTVTIDGINRGVLFGPGGMSAGGYYIDIPNGTTDDRGALSSFLITSATTYIRSAYFDRVLSSAFYYRIYETSATPPGFTAVDMQSMSVLLPGTCYTESQSNTWTESQSLDVVQGLPNGNYVLEFYIRAELYDVGIETGSCVVNATEQCNTSEIHPDRYISTRFNTTDPAACDLANIIANQSAPTKIIFQRINAPLPLELTYFKGKLRDKNVFLEWKTAQEQDLKDFLVERSGDSDQWSTLTAIQAAGNTTSDQAYAVLDEQPLPGINYYRLNARSYNGEMEFSPTIAVATSAKSVMILWPNPVHETLYYDLPEKKDGRLTFRVYDTQGQKLQEITQEGAAISLDQLGEGLYFLQVLDDVGNPVAVSRFLKVR